MRIAVAQIKTDAGDLARVTARMVALSHDAAARGADLLVFPVTTLNGPTGLPLGDQAPFASALVAALEAFAKDAALACLVPVVLDLGGGSLFEVVLARDGELSALRLAPHARDPLAAQLSPQLPVIEVGSSRVAIACSYEDLDLIGTPADLTRSDVVVFLSGYPFAVDDFASALGASVAETRYVEDARASGCWLVGVGGLGGYGPQVFCGSSFALSPDGRICALAASFEEDLLVADVGRGEVLPAGSELAGELFDERYFLWQALVLGLRDYVEKAGRHDVALPLDGSLSSVVLAALAADALGPSHVHALDCAPARHPRARHAALVARTLRIDVRELDGSIERVANGDGQLRDDLSLALLAALARQVDAVMLDPRDKTELALGTPRGVAPCGLAPLGDVYRIDVLDIARLRNAVSPVLGVVRLEEGDVPQILSCSRYAPEVLLERLDDALALHVEGGRTLAETADGIGDAELAEAVLRRLSETCALTEVPQVLAMSSCTLAEHALPHAFAWRDVASEGAGDAGGGIFAPLFAADAAGADGRTPLPLEALRLDEADSRELRDALDLLRDLSLGAGADWKNPFSEN